MATLYKNGSYWYLSVSYNNNRLTKSLGTKDKQLAKKLKPIIELELLTELTGIRQHTQNLPFDELVKRYLNANHGWSERTRELNDYVFSHYLSGKPLPSNPTSKAIFIRTINACWNWGLKQKLIKQAYKLEGDIKGEVRHRVFTDSELKTLFVEIQDKDFNAFVRFAYYTGARSGEIRSLKRENINSNFIATDGKTGKRIIKINSQAKKIIQQQNPLWQYRKDFISHKFKKECRRLGIKNARFHDLRRTFGYNLIKQGRPIYEVSKLLGHSSVTTTERHYAPLLTIDINDFIL